MSGAPLIYLPRVGSTNAWAKAHPGRFGEAGAVYTADQTAGRGRLGRSWAGAAGQALYYTASLALPAAGLPALPLAASLMVREALRRHYGVLCDVKWPNDLLLGGKKVVGILCEASAGRIVCGVGVNLAQPAAFFAAQGLGNATSLALQGAAVRLPGDLAPLARTLTGLLADARPALAAQGFAPWRDAYLAACVNLGRRVRWDGGAGTAVDVDGEGRLVVRSDAGGEVQLFTGEVRVYGLYGPCQE